MTWRAERLWIAFLLLNACGGGEQDQDGAGSMPAPAPATPDLPSAGQGPKFDNAPLPKGSTFPEESTQQVPVPLDDRAVQRAERSLRRSAAAPCSSPGTTAGRWRPTPTATACRSWTSPASSACTRSSRSSRVPNRVAWSPTKDVGTGEALQVPSLVNIAQRAPFMHTGCANTLRDRFDPACGGSKHGELAGLDAAQIDDLIAYLESL
jgi:hypothetical protein